MPADETWTLRPIGHVRSCFGDKFAVPRQPGLCLAAWGQLVFEGEFRNAEAIRGLEGFSHLWLVFGFHLTAEQGWHPTVRPPRLGGNKRVGVFASRSTFRPNGLGLSLVALEGIDATGPDAPVLHLGGLDLLDGTPVFDIKPYLPYAEALPTANPGFAGGEIPRLTVSVAREAEHAFLALPERAQEVIQQALALDPRPATHGESSEDRAYGAKLCGHNIRFTIGESQCTILSVTPLPS